MVHRVAHRDSRIGSHSSEGVNTVLAGPADRFFSFVLPVVRDGLTGLDQLVDSNSVVSAKLVGGRR